MVDLGVLIERDHIVSHLRDCRQRGEVGLRNFPGLLKRIIKEDMWQERYIEQLRKHQTFQRFNDFVTTSPLEGLGASMELLERMCRDDQDALKLLYEIKGLPKSGEIQANAPRNDDGTFKPSKAYNVSLGERKKEHGNSQSYLIRRLQRDFPEIAERWARGEIRSARAAAIEAGIIRVDNPLQAVKKAILKLSQSDKDELISWLLILGED